MFNPSIQYRCTIIRGKAQTELDDLLLTYATIINGITPIDKENYNIQFNEKLAIHFFKQSYVSLRDENKKTIRNHITEIAEKLFALSFEDESNIVYPSQTCMKILDDNDQPAFFKNLCFNFQQPNGTQKINTIQDKIFHKIYSRPLHLVLAVLIQSKSNRIQITKTDIAYYILNSLEVMQGIVPAKLIVERIIEDRSKGIKIDFNWSSSRDAQHIREQLNLLVLANLIKVEEKNVYLNLSELNLINKFCNQINNPLDIDYRNYDLDHQKGKSEFYSDWNKYNGSINELNPKDLETTMESLNFWNLQSESEVVIPNQKEATSASTKDIGDEGELIVLEFEKTRVGNFDTRMLNKIIHVGGTKGLGYDILSVEANELPKDPEFARYIEVKTTKRATTPDFNSTNWMDSINLTKREWIVARQFSAAFNIYRVYLTPFGNKIVKIANPFHKFEAGQINVEPMIYRLDFEQSAIDIKYK